MSEEIDYLKLDRSKFPVMEVSNNEIDWEPRIVIFTNGIYGCYAILKDDEKSFIEKGLVTFARWNHYRPIKQKKTRYMTPLEVMQFGIDNPNVIYRIKLDSNIKRMSSFASNFIPENHEYTTLANGQLGEWKEFLVEVEE